MPGEGAGLCVGCRTGGLMVPPAGAGKAERICEPGCWLCMRNLIQAMHGQPASPRKQRALAGKGESGRWQLTGCWKTSGAPRKYLLQAIASGMKEARIARGRMQRTPLEPIRHLNQGPIAPIAISRFCRDQQTTHKPWLLQPPSAAAVSSPAAPASRLEAVAMFQ